MSDSNDAMIEEFMVEATDLLDEAERSLLALDKGEAFDAQYNSVFRVFHSLKGAAGMLNLSFLQEHMHKVENLFQNLKAVGTISKSEVDFFLKATDGARRILEKQPISFDYTVPTVSTSVDSQSTTSESRPVSPSSVDKIVAFAVDDESDLVSLSKDVLQAAGFEVYGFTDAAEALNQIRERSPSVVITDISMPNMTGLEFLSEIKKVNSHLPVIFVTGYATKENLMDAISQGVFDVIEKPFKTLALASTVLRASKHYQLLQLIKRSINMLVYQFADLDDYLASRNMTDQRNLIRSELDTLKKQYAAALK